MTFPVRDGNHPCLFVFPRKTLIHLAALFASSVLFQTTSLAATRYWVVTPNSTPGRIDWNAALGELTLGKTDADPEMGASHRRPHLRLFPAAHETKWGSCNPESRNIRINTQLIQKPKDLVEYVVVHELVHLLEPTHSPRFIGLMDKNYPQWRESRFDLNELPLASESWK